MTSDFEGFLYQILSITLFTYPNYVLNFIYFTTITKQVNHARWHRCLRSDGLRVGGLGDHMTISHADSGYRTRVEAVRGECVNTAPARQPTILMNKMQFALIFR